jgi:hypothetical protein
MIWKPHKFTFKQNRTSSFFLYPLIFASSYLFTILSAIHHSPQSLFSTLTWARFSFWNAPIQPWGRTKIADTCVRSVYVSTVFRVDYIKIRTAQKFRVWLKILSLIILLLIEYLLAFIVDLFFFQVRRSSHGRFLFDFSDSSNFSQRNALRTFRSILSHERLVFRAENFLLTFRVP